MLIVNPRRNEEEAKEYAVTIGQCDIHCTLLYQCKWPYYTLVALSQNFTGKGGKRRQDVYKNLRLIESVLFGVSNLEDRDI